MAIVLNRIARFLTSAILNLRYIVSMTLAASATRMLSALLRADDRDRRIKYVNQTRGQWSRS